MSVDSLFEKPFIYYGSTIILKVDRPLNIGERKSDGNQT